VLRRLVRFPVVRRLLLSAPLVVIVSVVTFLLTSLAPSDAARQILGNNASLAQYARLRHRLGLDLPLYERYWRWLTHALHGDLGTSFVTGQAVTTTILERLPATLSLFFGSLLVIVLAGVLLGLVSAVRGGVTGRLIDTFGLVGFAVPGFWLGAVLIAVFAVKVHLFPAVGYVPFAASPAEWMRSLVLPIVALALSSVTGLAKQTREAMLDALASEHTRMSRANGMTKTTVVYVLAMKIVAIRVVTIVGLMAVGLLGGTVLVEQVFGLPGLGSVLQTSTTNRDLPMLQGITLFFALAIVGINLLVDMAYGWLDPRIRAV
jgi:peptide/nickel transport system permease protein